MSGVSIKRIWQGRGLLNKVLWALLVPAALLFSTIVRLRNLLHTAGWLSIRTLDRPVISIGNLTVGGTGKTPATVWLAQRLAERGFKVGILSRGYKRQESRVVVLSSGAADSSGASNGADAAAAGDEPAMMAWIYGLTVAVDKSRHRAGLALLGAEPVDVFLLDDGFQHRRLKRDMDIVLLGEDVPGWLLPCGPFREPAASLDRADCLVVTGATEKWQSILPAGGAPRFLASLEPQALVGLESGAWKEYPLTRLYRSRILAVAGIAGPEKFYRAIHEWDGEIVETLEFPDHHSYSASDWQQINRLSRHLDLVVTTEKDILKLVQFPFARDKLLALRVALVVVEGEALMQAIIDRIGSPPRPG